MIDPDGRSAEIIIDLEAGTVTFKSHFVFSGSEANEDTKNAAIQNVWNQQGLEVNGLQLNFEITGEVVSEKEAKQRHGENQSAANNFIAIESRESSGRISLSFKDGGNTGILLREDLEAGGKTAAHEFGHGLGWFSNGQAARIPNREDAGVHDYTGHGGRNGRIPGIMTPRETGSNGPNIIDKRLRPFSSDYLREDGFIDPSKRSNATQRDINFLNINLKCKSVGNVGSKFIRTKK